MYDLNSEQLAAVRHAGSPLLIIAGAGTGKTTVITQKIGWLIEQGLAKSDEILALTFTEKAAGEMAERVDMLLPYGYVDLWIMTFHSFAEKILRQHGLDIGLPTDFKLLNEFKQWALIKKNLDKFNLDYYRPLGNPTKFISALLQHFSRAKDEDISPADYLKYAEELKENVDAMLSGSALKRRGNSKIQIPNDKKIPNTKYQILNTTHEIPDAFENKEMAEQEIARINEVANAYHVYQQLLLDNSALDFGDLINYVLRLFRDRPLILAKFQKQFKYILVDEFQDTNWAQYELIKLLTGCSNAYTENKVDNLKANTHHPLTPSLPLRQTGSKEGELGKVYFSNLAGANLTVVGDDDQSIFRFRGASMSNILQFKQDYPTAEEIVLTQNYRSAQNILDAAYEFIKLNNPNRLEYQLNSQQQIVNSEKELSKKLAANIKDIGTIEVIEGEDLFDEVNKVIEKIAELKTKDKDCNWNDFAILVRANNSAKEFINALEIAGFPYIFLASSGLYNRPVIMDIIAYFNLLDNYHESTALYRVLNIPIFKFSHEEIINLVNLAKKKSWSLYEAVKYSADFDREIAEKAKIVLQSINRHTVLSKEKKAGEIAMAFLQDSGYLKFLSEQEEGKVKETMRELNLFKKRMDEFGAESGDASIKNFLTELNLEIESGEGGALLPDVEAGPEMIKILTVHAAKGLEFKYVFIVNMVDLRFPTTERHDPISLPDALVKEIIPAGDAHLEEERRLFYVAMTRAKTGLYFSCAPDYGGTRTKKPSRFLGELGIKSLELRNNEKEKVNFIKKVENVNLNKSKPVYELPKYYSYTQLQAYGNCPYQYRFAHILKIPTPGNYKFSFGQTMHLTLQKFFGLMIQNKNLPQADLFGSNAKIASTLPSQEDLLKLYAESWIDDWYESKAQKEELKAKGKDILKDFYARHKDNWPEVLSLEQGFNLRVGGQPIYGKIDRIDNLGERGIQIVDYKTGRPKEENKITLEEKEQLLIYQLAAEEVMQKKVANLQFYYLDNNSEINFLGTAEEKIKMQEKILAKIQAIETGIKNDDFPAKPSQLCKFCDFRSICEHRQL